MRLLSQKHTGERCPNCKKNIKILLGKIYGKVESNYRLRATSILEELRGTFYFEKLKEIYLALKSHRGYREFVKVKNLPHCDFYIPNPGYIFEFDESQHFTALRKITLQLYPEDFNLGFDRKKWIDLCDKIHAKDNDPPYRDEQRAWYDTLRDFLPKINGLRPTVRIFAKDFMWCGLDPSKKTDIESFKSFWRERP